MTIRLAHLSDLHFGPSFNIALWKAVRAEVMQFRPHVLVVSGDMVDSPTPLQLLAAKCELDDFAAEAGATLVVVPGNHDVYARGLGKLSARRDWFERIFYNNMEKVTKLAEEEYGERPAFTERYRSKPSTPYFASLLRRLAKGTFEAHIPARPQDRPLVSRPNCDVLIAALDSNNPGALGLATGRIDDDDLVSLREELETNNERNYLLRVAVVHHHLLPIAFSHGRLIGAEPFMVLDNAGTVLNLLAEHRFDLVLHGHKHVAQFARLDLSPRDEAGHSMAVVAAGSSALDSPNNNRGNCFNLVTVGGNGQLEVESFHYGGGAGPSRDNGYAIYREPLIVAKRRAFARARERHPLYCESRTQIYTVTETGDLLVEATWKGLSTTNNTHPHCRSQRVALPIDSWLASETVTLDEEFSSPGVTVELDRENSSATERVATTRQYKVHFPDGSLRGSGVTYRLTYACANSIIMTPWECAERARWGQLSEGTLTYVGIRVTHPVENLSLTLKLPPTLANVQPYVSCRRIPQYPVYDMDPSGDAVFSDDSDWIIDPAMTKHESSYLHFDARSEAWLLRVDRPLVGYEYQLQWRIPTDQADATIRGEVRHLRETLLEAFHRQEAGGASWPSTVIETFSLLARELERLFGRGSKNEHRSVDFLVYDGQEVALRPVLSKRTWTSKPHNSNLVIPLGCGIAGVAFQQGLIIPWVKGETDSPFVRPEPYDTEDDEPDAKMRTILAIPIFHASQHHLGRPAPWSCIGVVSFRSSSDASKIPQLLGPLTHDITDAVLVARGLAHAAIDAVLNCLERSRKTRPLPLGSIRRNSDAPAKVGNGR
ncbi:metallophosphoesterase family protein [Sinorhizobium meliloti]|uniref:metallophosphoesterase family protein n=1 Tax=Rhizobium meliloti TaxID=382 RepID=UPI003F154609